MFSSTSSATRALRGIEELGSIKPIRVRASRAEGLVWGVTSFCLAVKVVPPTKSGHLRWPQVAQE